jgi:uncharacterized BrkB/YihY/UPF0761 family membrane protein
VGAIMVLMLWLYVTGLMVLVGAEANAVLAQAAEERKDIRIVQPQGSGDRGDTLPNSTGKQLQQGKRRQRHSRGNKDLK